MKNTINPLPPSFTWTQIPTTFPPRWGHSLVNLANSLLLFAGYSGQYLSDLWHYDLQVFKWSQFQLSNPPEPRSHHTAVAFFVDKKAKNEQNSQKMITFGGKTKNNRVLGDLYELNWDIKKWKLIENKGIGPCGRSGHSAEILLGEYMVVYGGENIVDLNDLWVLELRSYQWKKMNVYGKAPKARKFHSSCVYQDRLYILGGCYDNYESLGYEI